MTLYEFIEQSQPWEEFDIHDKDYDIETYFYDSILTPEDDWDKAMAKIAKKLEVVEVDCTPHDRYKVTVNLSDVIDKNVKSNDEFKELFIINSTDAIMDDIENIFAGHVSEAWIMAFADSLV